MTANQSWKQLISIQAGGALSLPMLIVGQILFETYGWSGAAWTIALGNLFLLSLGVLFASLSASRRATTVEHVVRSMGNRGRILFSLIMMSVVLGWFGVQLNVIAAATNQVFLALGLNPLPQVALNIVLGVVISAAISTGMKRIKLISNFVVPLLALSLIVSMSFLELGLVKELPESRLWLGGMALVIGAHIAAVIDMPTFLRHARSKKDALMCIFFLYGLIVPLIEWIGVYFGCCSGGKSIFDTIEQGGYVFWKLWLAGFMILAGWVTNNANLYSAVASAHSLVSKGSGTAKTIILGTIGTGFACLDLLGNLGTTLQFFGILIGSMGATMIANYLVEKRQKTLCPPFVSICSAILGMLVGITTFFSLIRITTVPVLDTFTVTLSCYFMLNALFKRSLTIGQTVNN